MSQAESDRTILVHQRHQQESKDLSIGTVRRLKTLDDAVNRAMRCDQYRLRRRLQSLQRRRSGDETLQRQLDGLAKQIDQSSQRRERRAARLPSVVFDQELPVIEKREQIAQAIKQHQVVVVCGETGSGKSTQLPKICLDIGLGVNGMIGHTQPRRIAARSIANRLGEELGVSLGQEVGFKVRFTDKTNPGTYIKLMTDGILLAETQGDRFLDQYEAIILDEAHERSLNVDFLIGYLKRLLPKRPDLRVIITSATLDAERFSLHFSGPSGPAPIIEVSGRIYPVEVRYRPLENEDDEQDDVDELTGLVAAVHELTSIDRGHILIFLPTERDIREAAKRLRAEKLPGDGTRQTEILPLYARLSTAEQNRVFQTCDYRRIVLATNVAESSLTVPGIRYVIDTGTARISRYSPRSKVQRLPIEAVSQASADQRTGRCGRIGPGICVRLFSEQDFLQRDRYSTPEIRRTNLAAVILQAKALKLGPVEQFPFLDPPRPESIRDGYTTLFEIGAVDVRRELTDLGRQLSRLPVDPRIGRMIVAGHHENCLNEILIIASALEIRDPRERPLEKRNAADEQHEKFSDQQSDFVSFFKLWGFYHHLKETLSRNQLRRACRQNFLSLNRLREWTEIHRQLLRLTADAGMKVRARTDDYAAIHRALLAGLLSGLAYRTEEHEYTGAGGVRFYPWPGSGLFQQKPKWIMAAELLETTRRYGRTVAKVNPDWVEPLAAHLVKRSYSDPHWHRKSSTVMALEKVTLFGLPIVTRRRVPYARIDPEKSRELFIQHGLVEQQLEINDKFYLHNRTVLEEADGLAAKTRKSNYIFAQQTVFDFYDQRMPRDVVDLASLRRWLNRPENETSSKTLQMLLSDLMEFEQDDLAEGKFPNTFECGSMQLPVRYRFQTGTDSDGVTITVPREGLSQLSADRLGWLVPGLLEAKIVALIRSLPKSIRRGLVPAPDTARTVAKQLNFASGPFLDVLAARLSEIAGQRICTEDFEEQKLPPHFQVNVQVVDDDGRVQAQGRDVGAIQAELGGSHTSVSQIETSSGQWSRDGIVQWDLDSFPIQIAIIRNNIELPAYPTLIDTGTDVRLRLTDSEAISDRLTRHGLRRLYAIAQRKPLKSQVRWLPRLDEICLFASPLLSQEGLRNHLADLIAGRAFVDGLPIPRSTEDFETRLQNSAERIGMATQEVAVLIPKLFEGYHQARLALEEFQSSRWAHAKDDIRDQLNVLANERFLTETPWQWLSEYPRYFQAIPYRLDKIRSGSSKRDLRATEEIRHFWGNYVEQESRNRGLGRFDQELELFRWMIEEYRVSAFAQPLGTSVPVSTKRLEKQWAKVMKS